MTAPESIQRRVADRYVLKSVLGRGGMGVVWRADDTLLQREVAIKEIEFPRALGVDDLDVVKQRAAREARTAAALAHSNVVTIYDTIHEDGRAYIVMELVEAPTVATLIERDGPMSPEKAAGIALDILEALQVAHASQIVHRDVKPANVMVPGEGRAKLADFGIATVKDDPKLTSTGMVLGSPQFMAPEQASGARSGTEADLWALGATLYYMVEGVSPFDKGEPIPTLAAVVHDDPRSPERAGPLEPLIFELLSKNPHARPSTQRTKAMLEDVVGAGPLVPVYLEEEPSTEESAVDAPDRVVTRDRPQDRAKHVVAAITAILVMAAGALFLATRPGPTRPSDSGVQKVEHRGQPNTETVPARWDRYEDPDTGYQLAHPPGWIVQPLGDTRTDFRHPSNGTYLRVDWTDEPGPSPKAAWESFSESFAARHDDYNEIRIEASQFKGYDAAVWEFTYSDGGASLHAIDLGFVTGEYGFALNFQTHEADWVGSQKTFDRFKASFEPPE